MFLTGGRDANAGRKKNCGTAAMPDSIAGRYYADPSKALVMSYIGQLVSDGYAEWRLLESGNVELRIFNGETFLLADTSVIRIV